MAPKEGKRARKTPVFLALFIEEQDLKSFHYFGSVFALKILIKIGLLAWIEQIENAKRPACQLEKYSVTGEKFSPVEVKKSD